MSVWFDGHIEIKCNIQQVKRILENHGEHFAEVISFIPGLDSIELVE